jgi:translation initiation factor 1 (eIF-1/SUI1)
MSENEVVVGVSDLSKEDKETVESLARFLEEKTGGTARISDDEIKLQNMRLRKPHLRVLIRKFLHKEELKEYFRVIISAERLVIKERKR